MRNCDEMDIIKFLKLLKRMCEPDVSLRENDKTPDEIILHGFEKLTMSDKISVLKMINVKGDLTDEDKNNLRNEIKETTNEAIKGSLGVFQKTLLIAGSVFILIIVAAFLLITYAPVLFNLD